MQFSAGFAVIGLGILACSSTAEALSSVEARRDATVIKTERAPQEITTGFGECLAKLPRLRRQFEENLENKLRIVYRKINPGEPDRFFLVSVNGNSRGCNDSEMAVLSTLTIPRLNRSQWFGASFDCRDTQEVVQKGKPVIGVFSTKENSIPAHAVRAWTVDFRTQAFVEVINVSCFSFAR